MRLCQVVVREMKRLTGFGRCLVYRFDPDGHGEVLAERLDPGYDAYAGHRFPASDIPARRAQLYLVKSHPPHSRRQLTRPCPWCPRMGSGPAGWT
jgi:light-regulated signal transduction histidine kinase (bacteriophytochrome)